MAMRSPHPGGRLRTSSVTHLLSLSPPSSGTTAVALLDRVLPYAVTVVTSGDSYQWDATASERRS